MQDITNDFKTTPEGAPTGGTSKSVGIDISWQDGPLGRDGERKEPNGAFVETVIQVAIDRLAFFNDSKFRSRENSLAITKLEEALHWLEARTSRREKLGIEGTHKEDPKAQS